MSFPDRRLVDPRPPRTQRLGSVASEKRLKRGAAEGDLVRPIKKVQWWQRSRVWSRLAAPTARGAVFLKPVARKAWEPTKEDHEKEAATEKIEKERSADKGEIRTRAPLLRPGN